CIVREPLAKAIPVAGANRFVVRHHVVVQEADSSRHVQFVSHQTEQNSVRPLAVTPEGASSHALADEAGALGMTKRAFVEPVDLQLQPVVPQVANEMLLEQ